MVRRPTLSPVFSDFWAIGLTQVVIGPRQGHASTNMVHLRSVLLLSTSFYFHSPFYSSKNNFLSFSTGSTGSLLWTILYHFPNGFAIVWFFPKHYHFCRLDRLYFFFYLVSHNIHIVRSIKWRILRIEFGFLHIYTSGKPLLRIVEYFLHPMRFSCALFILFPEGVISFLTSRNIFLFCLFLSFI